MNDIVLWGKDTIIDGDDDLGEEVVGYFISEFNEFFGLISHRSFKITIY